MKNKTILFIIIMIAIIAVAGIWFWKRQSSLQVDIMQGDQSGVVEQTKTLEALTDAQGNVTVDVMPINFSVADPVWAFEVSINTHTVELNDDMAMSSFLVDAVGKAHAADIWEGDPPGGHHRRGVLRFAASDPVPSVLTVRIQNVGGVTERVFSWDLVPQTEREAFIVPEQEYDFGVVKQSGGIVQHQFTFTYHGTQELKVLGVPTSCSCTSAVIDDDVLHQGDTATITVSFDPNLHEEPLGKFYKTITLLTEPKAELVPEWKIWAEIDLDLGPEAYKLKGHED